MGETAKAVMPDEITDGRFLQEWKEEIQEVAEYVGEIQCPLERPISE